MPRSQERLRERYNADSAGIEMPRFTTAPVNQTDAEGAASYDVGALADLGYPTGSFSASGLPTGLSINASTGNITGTATVVDDFAVTVRVANAYGGDSKSFVWTIT